MFQEPITWSAITTSISYIGSAVFIASAILLWIYRELNKLRSEITDFRIEVAREYVTLVSMRHLEERVETALLRLEDRLDKILTYIDGVYKGN